MPEPERRRGLTGLLGWWYAAIGAGFVLLGANRLVLGDRPLAVAVRWVIAVGFFALAYFEFKVRRR